MKRIGLISDTHGYLGADVCSYLADVDEIWHAGDIGNIAVLDKIRAMKVRARWVASSTARDSDRSPCSAS